MDPVEDPELLYIAKLGLIEPVPEPWLILREGEEREGEEEIIYFNPQTGEKQSQHPSDEKFRRWYLEEKRKKQKALEFQQ